MKILFIADNLPELTSGSRVRNFYLLNSLVHENLIDVIGFLNQNSEPLNLLGSKNINYELLKRARINLFDKIRFLISGKIPYIELRKKTVLPKQIIDNFNKYDLIHLAELNSFFVIQKYLHEIKVPIVLDAHNIEYVRLKSEFKNKSFIARLIGKTLLQSLKKEELYAIRNIQYLLTCSDVDKDYFQKFMSNKKIFVIPNGVNLKYFQNIIPKKSNKGIILFMGLLSYFPNEQGLKFYIKYIHPLVKKGNNNMEFHIIGRNAPSWLRDSTKKDKSIKLFGFVKDQRQYIANADVCVAPILSGSGTRLKILEYMAMKKAVVATYQAAEGIEVRNHRNVLLAKDCKEFAAEITKILNNKVLANNLGENAYKLIEKNYQWEKIGQELNKIYSKLI